MTSDTILIVSLYVLTLILSLSKKLAHPLFLAGGKLPQEPGVSRCFHQNRREEGSHEHTACSRLELSSMGGHHSYSWICTSSNTSYTAHITLLNIDPFEIKTDSPSWSDRIDVGSRSQDDSGRIEGDQGIDRESHHYWRKVQRDGPENVGCLSWIMYKDEYLIRGNLT